MRSIKLYKKPIDKLTPGQKHKMEVLLKTFAMIEYEYFKTLQHEERHHIYPSIYRRAS